MAKNKKYYWLKLKDDFFDDDTIKFIEEQENGIKYSNFYLKLCLKSLKTNGKLIRLVGETLIPYDINSLSKLTGVDFDTVRSAMQLFESIKLIKVLDSGEIYLSQIDELIGSETDKAQLMRRLRAERKEISNNVTKMLPYIDIDKDIDIEKDIKKKNKKEKKETEFDLLINEKIADNQLKETIYEFVKMRKTIKKPLTTKGLQLIINKLFKLSDNLEEQIQILNNSIMNNWQGIFQLKDEDKKQIKVNKKYIENNLTEEEYFRNGGGKRYV